MMNMTEFMNESIDLIDMDIDDLEEMLDAFSCPNVKLSHEQTLRRLDEAQAAYQHLEARLGERETYFKQRETELQQKYDQDLKLARENLIELETSAKNQIHALEVELSQKETTHVAEVAKIHTDTDLRVQAYESQVRNAKENEQILTTRLAEMTSKVNELTEKAHSNEIEFSEKIQMLTTQLEKLRTDSEQREQELLSELSASKDERRVLKQQKSRISPEKSMNGSMNQSQSLLQDEVESLRCVLELKQTEIAELRKQNQEMQRSVDDHNALVMKFASAESRLEDLQVQLQCKMTQESELLDKIKQLEEKYNQELKMKARSAQYIEELQYRLKQNSEKFSATLTELTKNMHENTWHAGVNNKLHNGVDFLSRSQSHVETGSSPPTSPVIKGVVEKSDSVSWVLEMDDEAPEVLASRVVRRAGSFRSNNYLSTSMTCQSTTDKCSQSPVPKRQKCQSASPLQSSASATSVLRRNNSDRSPQHHEKDFVALRNRSKSVTIKQNNIGPTPKKLHAKKNLSMSFEDAPRMYTSSPRLVGPSKDDFPEVFIEETSPFEVTTALDSTLTQEEFHRDKTPSFKKNHRENRGLITCDTTKLLKDSSNRCTTETKKRKPKIGAGEALISGSNSEDDDDTEEELSESCSSSSSASSSDLNCEYPREVLSIEDALMKKIGCATKNSQHITQQPASGSNTPMDVSWSEHIHGNDDDDEIATGTNQIV